MSTRHALIAPAVAAVALSASASVAAHPRDAMNLVAYDRRDFRLDQRTWEA